YWLLATGYFGVDAVAPQEIRGRGPGGGLVALGQLRQDVRGEEVAEEGVTPLVGDAALAQAGAGRGGQAQIGAVGGREKRFQALPDALGQAGTRAFGRDGDRELIAPPDGRHYEGAARGPVHDGDGLHVLPRLF